MMKMSHRIGNIYKEKYIVLKRTIIEVKKNH